MNSTAKLWFLLGGSNAALAVLLGAFAAHALRSRLGEPMLSVYHTANQYHFYHALGLLVVALLTLHLPASNWLRCSGSLMFAGIVLFSGSLYLLAITEVRWLGGITPLGGSAFVLAWCALLVAVVKGH